MISKFSLVVLIALYFYAPSINGEECIPVSVLNLRIAANAVLSWEVSPDEPCVVDEFQVDVEGDRHDEFHFKVNETFVDLSFLEICELWHFIVTPISNGTRGYERRLVEHVPLPPSADISLSYFYITAIGSRSLHLDWDLNNHTHGDCTLRYHITIEDEDQGDIQDIYVSEMSADIHNLSPCVSYQIAVRAVNRAHPTIEGPMRIYSYEIPPQPEEAPILNSITIGVSSVNMTWNLEKPGRNRCPLRNIHVDGGSYFNISFPLNNPDDRPPVPINIQGLQPDSMYVMRVSVENSGGVSKAATLAAQTLELVPEKKLNPLEEFTFL